MLDERARAIIQKIIGRPLIEKNELMTETSLTQRQLDYSLDKINSWLVANQQSGLIIENNQVKIKQETKRYLIEEMNTLLSSRDYVLSPQERVKYLFLLLFYYEDEYLSMNHFIDALQVGKTTIMNDLKTLGVEISKHNLAVTYNRKDGYKLSGNELDIRYYLMKLVILEISEENNAHLLDLFIEEQSLDGYQETRQIVTEKLRLFQLNFVENRLAEFVYTFILLKNRLNRRFTSTDGRYQLSTLTETNEYQFSLELLKYYGEYNEQSVAYLCAWILGLSVGNLENKFQDYFVIMDLVERIMLRFETLSGIRFNNHPSAVRQLYCHFRPVYYRLYFHLPIVNPLCEKIKKEYKELFQIVQETLRPIGSIFGQEIPEEEIAFLTMHFAALSTTFHEHKVSQKVAIIVCPNGIGSSSIVYTELKSTFPEFVFLGPIETNELEKMEDSYDIIFSTVPNIRLFYSKKPVYIVSPIMGTAEKYKLIRDVYAEVGNQKFKLPSVRHIMDIIQKYTTIKEEDMLEKELYEYFLVQDELNEMEEGPSLAQICHPDCISLNVVARNWEEAIRLSAAPLLKQGKITRNYIETIIDNARTKGAFMVITKHVALPHARPEAGVNELSISITTLRDPVVFEHKENDPVKYIFCLAAIDNKRHLNAMSELVQLLDNAQFYALLDEEKNPEKVFEFIKHKKVIQ